ncbi:serine hydrolase [Pseudalkalibacillus hwajinpoensis]|uniref:serine hydrolase domain-containing protein n=1 Tax=Guptibacillus hwajinpoensis TaxID=208199 RepID=UPI00325A72A4
MLDRLDISIEKFLEDRNFSGAVVVKSDDEVLKTASGFANRAEERFNDVDTRFGIASGCKVFTAIAITQLVEKDVLSFKTRLVDCLDISFPHFHDEITIHHLLTHTSGIPDYFDEDVMEDFEDLWKQTPMYHLKSLKDFLPLFQNGRMVANPGESFRYNNAGYIVLGLIIEQQTGMSFQDYIKEHIFPLADMQESGYFSMDCLPKNTAIGYIDEKDGSWRTNTYSVPIMGGSDGGAYVTAPDMIKLWEALVGFRLLDENHTTMLLTPHVRVKVGVNYGYGVWLNSGNNSIVKYHVMGYDPGVSFHSAYYPMTGVKVAIPSNRSSGAIDVMKVIEDQLELLDNQVK